MDVDEALAQVVDRLGGQRRSHQESMSRAVAAALDDGHHLLVQAGTGTGKSLAYLVPAVLHAVSADSRRVVVSTATLALQRQLMDRDVPAVVSALAGQVPRPVSVALLKGRSNYVCRLRLAGGDDEIELMLPGTGGSRGRLEEQAALVQQWAETTSSGDRDELPAEVDTRVWRSLSVTGRECVGRTRCEFGESCFAERARDAAREADVVVTNHALVAIDMQGDAAALPEFDAIILDEAHEFTDRVVAAGTELLSTRQLEGLPTTARRLLDEPSHAALVQSCAAAAASLEDLGSTAGERERITALPAGLVLALSGLRDSLHAAIGLINSSGEIGDAAVRQRVKADLEDVHDLAGRILSASDNDVVWFTGAEDAVPTLHRAPLSVRGMVREGLMSRATVVATSATLTVGGDFGHLASGLGLTPAGESAESGERWESLDVGSPFRYREQAILYIAADLPRPGREGIAGRTLDRVADLVTAAGGRSLVLLSSWRSVDAVAARLELERRLNQDAMGEVLVQQRGTPVGYLIDRFRKDETSSLVGTMSLWQGVDVPGASCIQVIVERLPFPRPDDPVVSARQSLVDRSGGSGFFTVSVPSAALMLAQGVGRLIRSEEDRGVVAILDSRLATAGYGTYVRASLPPFWTTTDAEVALAALRRLTSGP